MCEELRIRVKRKFQKELFRKLYKKAGSITDAANSLDIPRPTYCNYHYCRNRHIPISIIKKLTKILKTSRETLDRNTEEKIDLRKIRIKYCLSKTYDKLKLKYGENWSRELRRKSELILKKKYGKNWHDIISKMGLNALKAKYGSNWNKIIRNKAINGLIKKFGENWGEVLNKKAMRALKKKYGKDFLFQLYQLSRVKLRAPLTDMEKKFKLLLEKNNIKHETHVRNSVIEFDFVIPNLSKPLIVCELSNIKPITNSLRFKIAEMLVQKSLFPSAYYFCVLRREFKKKGKKHYFNPDLGRYLLDKNIFIFWPNELLKLTKIIKNILNGKQTNDLNRTIKRRQNEFETKLKSFSRLALHGAKTAKKQVRDSEKKFNKLLLECGANPKGPTIFSTKYGGFVVVDDYEECDGTKIVYEITHARQPRALAALAGKIAYLKDSCNLKTVVVVRDVKENWGLRWLELLSDKVIKFDDKTALESTRNELLNIKGCEYGIRKFRE